jgi:hypothetical protein
MIELIMDYNYSASTIERYGTRRIRKDLELLGQEDETIGKLLNK